MEQVHNSMLDLMQMVTGYPSAASTTQQDNPPEQSDFRKLMEQSQSAQESQADSKAPEAEDGPDTVKAPKGEESVEDTPEVQEQIALAALAALQNPVVPIQQTLAPVVQEAAPAAVAPTQGGSSADGLAVDQMVRDPQEGQGVEQMLPGQTQTAEPQTQAAQVQPQAEAQSQADNAGAGQSQAETGPGVTVKAETDGEQTQQAAVQETPVFQRVESTPIKVGEAPKGPQGAEMANVETQVSGKLTQAIQNGETRVELQLEPANLGKVNVELTLTDDGVLQITLRAENSHTRNLLEGDIANLQAILGRDNQQEVRVEVPPQQESQRQDLYDREQQEHQHQQRQQQQEERRDDRRDGQDFLHQLRLGLIPMDGEAS